MQFVNKDKPKVWLFIHYIVVIAFSTKKFKALRSASVWKDQLWRYGCVGDTHIGAASSDEADLHIKSSTGPPTLRDPHPSSLPLEA